MAGSKGVRGGEWRGGEQMDGKARAKGEVCILG